MYATEFREGDREVPLLALALPDVEEGVACKGTAIQSVTCKVKGKAFLFLRPGNMMLKLEESTDQATELSRETSGSMTVGKGGWVTIRDYHFKKIKISIIKTWITESHGLFANSQSRKKAKRKAERT